MRILITILSLCLFTACGVKKEEKNTQILVENHSVDTFSKYLSIKDALVASDRFEASSSANEMLKTDQPDDIKTALMTISNSSTIEEQREAFEKLSIEFYNLVKAGDSEQDVIYKQYCPMAFGNKGAFWLSTEKEIMNPYFGDAMLRCGRIEEILD